MLSEQRGFSIWGFTITAEILRAHWLIFIDNKRTDTRIYNLCDASNCPLSHRADNLTICHRKNQIDVSFSCVCPVIDTEFHHNIVKVVGLQLL